ncbi:hypothetical protein GCM10009731_13370 [Streptomyces globosus]|jgi:hypothetical protein
MLERQTGGASGHPSESWTPEDRGGRPEDTAALVALPVGPSAAFGAGQSVHADGGRLLHRDAYKQGDRPE